MRTLLACVVAVVAITGCGNKNKDKDKGSEAKPEAKTVAPTTCPPGNAIGSDGACTPVVTAEKVAAVAQEQSRLDELGKMIDKADVIAATVQLVDGLRQLDAWKQLSTASAKFKAVDDVAQVLSDGVKQLATFRAGLGDASAKLGDLKGTLDKMLHDTGAAQQLADVRKQVSDQLRAALQPLEAQTIDLVNKVIVPLTTQLDNVSDLVIGGCAMAKVSGANDKLKEMCATAKDVFARATVYLADLKTKPAELFTGVSANIEKQLDQLIDTGAKTLIDEAQTKINDALKLPAAGSGSAAAPGSGSAH
jgi:hypothetical protein